MHTLMDVCIYELTYGATSKRESRLEGARPHNSDQVSELESQPGCNMAKPARDTCHLTSQVPRTTTLMVYGTRVLKYVVLGPSGYHSEPSTSLTEEFTPVDVRI